jgi:FlaG/FlaF family flagellin (archaellin)
VRYPWLLPTIVVVAVVVVVAGIVYAVVNGLLFSAVILQSPSPSPS